MKTPQCRVKKYLSDIIKVPSYINSTWQPSLTDVYIQHMLWKAQLILATPDHPLQKQFVPIPLGWRNSFRGICKDRPKFSLILSAIIALNLHWSMVESVICLHCLKAPYGAMIHFVCILLTFIGYRQPDLIRFIHGWIVEGIDCVHVVGCLCFCLAFCHKRPLYVE